MAGLESALAVISSNLNILHSPSSTPETRRAAQSELDRVKKFGPEAIVQIATRLLLPVTSSSPLTATQPEIHFGFHVLEDALMREAWSSLSEQLRHSVRELVVVAVKSSGREDLPPFVKKKAASVLSGIAIREWPQRWPTFIEDLVGGDVPVQMICGVLHMLSEDIIDFSSIIESARRRELAHALTLSLPVILQFVTSTIEKAYEEKNSTVLLFALATLTHYLSWCPAHIAFQHEAPRALCRLLVHREVRDEAIEALRTFCSRGDQKMQNAADRFRDDVFIPLLEFCNTVNVNSTDPDEHEFVVKLTDLLRNLGKYHLEEATILQNARAQDSNVATTIASKYIDIMLELSVNPSLAVCRTAIPFFSSLFGSLHKSKTSGEQMVPESTEKNQYEELVSRTLEALTVSVSRVKLSSFDEQNDTGEAKVQAQVLHSTFAQLDFDSLEEYSFAFHDLHVIANQAVVKSAKLSPSVCVRSSLSALGNMFGRNVEGTSERISNIRGVVIVAEAVTAAVAQSNIFDEGEARQLLEMCFARVLSSSTEYMNRFRYSALRLFVPLYKRNSEALKAALEILVRASENSKTFDTPLDALLGVCKRLQSLGCPALGEYAAPLCEMAVKAMSAPDTGSILPKSARLDVACYSILEVSDFAERVKLVEKLLVAPLTTVTDTRLISSVYNTPENLYNFLTNGNPADIQKVISGFRLLEAGVHRVAKPQIFKDVLTLPNELSPTIAPQVVKVVSLLIETLHALHDPSVFPSANSDRRKVLRPTQKEYAFLLNISQKDFKTGAVDDRALGSLMGSEGFDSGADTVQTYLKRLRDSCYELAMNAILSGVTLSEPHLTVLLNALCSHYIHMRPLHLYYLAHRVLSVLLSNRLFLHHESLGNDSLASFARLLDSSALPALIRHITGLLTAAPTADGNLQQQRPEEIEEIELGQRILNLAMVQVLRAVYQARKEGEGLERSVPVVMDSESNLGAALWELFRCVVGATGGSKGGLNLLRKLVEWAPKSPEEGMRGVGRLLGTVLATAIVRGFTEVGDLAERVIMSMIEKWGALVVAQGLMQAVSTEGPEVVAIMRNGAKDLVDIGATDGVRKKAMRDTLRKLLNRLDRLASTKGWSTARQLERDKSARAKTVKSLPDKLNFGKSNGSRDASQMQRIVSKPGEEVILTDSALDSLFGKGEPL